MITCCGQREAREEIRAITRVSFDPGELKDKVPTTHEVGEVHVHAPSPCPGFRGGDDRGFEKGKQCQ